MPPPQQKTTKMDDADFEPMAVETLAPELLRLDPTAIAGMARLAPVDEADCSVVSDGLNRFMRKALANYLASPTSTASRCASRTRHQPTRTAGRTRGPQTWR